jgi:tRNA-splicing ligase RtcB (3'-phosphate/5'-hydroxy nucleic acid ligase)
MAQTRSNSNLFLAPWKQWGRDIETAAVQQMINAASLPVAVAGALMPDAHVGYGLPIGGVLATEGAVIPYAVGVDIACRMKLSVLDLPPSALSGQKDRLAKTLEQETRFGVGATFRDRRVHPVMDREWSVSPITKRFRDKAWGQLGTSGSGNHFVEYGLLTVTDDRAGLPEGEYLALLSHSGSRGVGAQVCQHYSRLAMDLHPELPRELKHLSWLPLDTGEGQEYWEAMTLMGHYASACHELIHRSISKRLGAKIIGGVENHHNFAWKEKHQIGHREREVIVHRKGATPAAEGDLGVIPGSMAAPGFVVRGRGSASSLHSASHGAGRVMSRKQATLTFTWSETRKQLAALGIEVLSAGVDEVPGVYKDIHSVMAAQKDLVEVLARFDPKIVKMCPPGEKAED